jgi:hypothetical protein
MYAGRVERRGPSLIPRKYGAPDYYVDLRREVSSWSYIVYRAVELHQQCRLEFLDELVNDRRDLRFGRHCSDRSPYLGYLR